jgi:hypothetical protein
VGYEIVIPDAMRAQLSEHLLTDRTQEQMAVLLCGVARSGGTTRLLARHVALMPSEAFQHQSAGGLELDQRVNRHLMSTAAAEGLSQVDLHTHPGDGSDVAFSSIDDENEQVMSQYLAARLPRTLYGSIVINGRSLMARVWAPAEGPGPRPATVRGLAVSQDHAPAPSAVDARYDRQTLAFGREFQARMSRMRVGLVGLGGLGSVIAEQLGRMGVEEWVLIDPDRIERSNLNRLQGSAEADVLNEAFKVEVAERTLRRLNGRSRASALRVSVQAPRAQRLLRTCDVIVVATDNHASRLVLNHLACQYLIPLMHVGVNIEVDRDGVLTDVSGEVALPELGVWCLVCSGLISVQTAGFELATDAERARLTARGYLDGLPAPAVYHLNATVASLAVAELHNLVTAYKPSRRYLVYRELATELLPISVEGHSRCAFCRPEGVLALGDLAEMPRYARSGAIAPPIAMPAGADCERPEDDARET